ncbi:MAG: hypothetical protein AAGL10_15835 [Pseudomonadota bacterium]
MQFDMSAAWSRGMELIRDNFSLLVIVAAVFLLLPSVAIYLMFPDFATMADPTADQAAVEAMVLDMIGPLIGIGLGAIIVQFAGYGAIIALMGDGRPTVGEAIVTGFKIVPSMIAVFVLFLVAYFLAALILIVPFSLLGGFLGSPEIFGLLAVIPIFLMVIYIAARMSLTMPVAILENTLNPFKAIWRSVKLTGPSQWSILIFWVVLFIAYFVIALLLGAVFGVLAAIAGTGVTAMLILGLLNGAIGMAIGLVICGVSVAMHRQLAGMSDEDIASTFD